MTQNADTLLNYVFKLDVQTPTPEASTDWLRAVVAVVKPKAGTTIGNITQITSASAAAELTDNKDLEQLFAAGMSSVYVLPMNDLNLSTPLHEAQERFYTVLISSDFTKEEIDALNVGNFTGVVGACFDTQADAQTFAIGKNKCAFLTGAQTKGKNLFYAFGAFLSASTWNNQQYISMPFSDGIEDLATADALSEKHVSFVLTSAQYGARLAFFCAGGQAIVAPYVTQELIITLQGAALQYLSANRPQYTLTQAKLLQDYLQETADVRYTTTGLLAYVDILVSLLKTNYTAQASVKTPEPTALWRLVGTLAQEVLQHA